MSVKQIVLWAEWAKDSSRVIGGTFSPIPLEKRPDKVWTLYLEADKEKPPGLPFRPVHHHNAWLEDVIHDWNWRGGVLNYATRILTHSCWVLVEYD